MVNYRYPQRVSNKPTIPAKIAEKKILLLPLIGEEAIAENDVITPTVVLVLGLLAELTDPFEMKDPELPVIVADIFGPKTSVAPVMISDNGQ